MGKRLLFLLFFSGMTLAMSGQEFPRAVPATYGTREEALGGRSGDVLVFDEWTKEGETLYGTTFTLPGRTDRTVFLSVGRTDQPFDVMLNGKTIGRNEDPKTTAQFRLTDALRSGENRIGLLFRASDTLSFPQVRLFSQPAVRLKDYRIETSFSEDGNDGILDTYIEVANDSKHPAELQAGYDILDHKGDILTYNYATTALESGETDTVHLRRILRNVRKWSPGDPNLYTLTFRIRQNGRYTEYLTVQAGFRTTAPTRSGWLVNGDTLRLKGIVTGRPDSLGRKELAALKKQGFNALTWSVQPKDEKIYGLCDSVGLLVFDTFNTESAGAANDPSRLDAFIGRIRNRYYTARNHPSVAAWVFDRTGNGYNLYKGYLFLKRTGDPRPVLHREANCEWNTDLLVLPPEFPGDERPILLFDYEPETPAFEHAGRFVTL